MLIELEFNFKKIYAFKDLTKQYIWKKDGCKRQCHSLNIHFLIQISGYFMEF